MNLTRRTFATRKLVRRQGRRLEMWGSMATMSTKIRIALHRINAAMSATRKQCAAEDIPPIHYQQNTVDRGFRIASNCRNVEFRPEFPGYISPCVCILRKRGQHR